MQITHLFAALVLVGLGAAHAAGNHDHGHQHKPLHGGVVVESKDMDFELVAKSDVITLHLRDHGKPANTQGMSAKLTLLNGTEKSEVMLAPAGSSTLEAKGSFKVAPGTKAVAFVTMPGKKVANVRFAIK